MKSIKGKDAGLLKDGRIKGNIFEGDLNDFETVSLMLHLDVNCGTAVYSGGYADDPDSSFVMLAITFNPDDTNPCWLGFKWELAWKLARYLASGCEHTDEMGLYMVDALAKWATTNSLSIPPAVASTAKH